MSVLSFPRQAKCIQGLALRVCAVRLQLILHAYVIWTEPDLAFSEHWVPLADVPAAVILSFLRAIGNSVSVIHYLVSMELNRPYMSSQLDVTQTPVTVIPFPGHPSYSYIHCDPRNMLHSITAEERRICTGPAEQKEIFAATHKVCDFNAECSKMNGNLVTASKVNSDFKVEP